MGVYFYIYTGGEPLVRKQDLIALCQKHHDCIFLSFTNGTLIDEAFAQDMLRVKNFIPAISVEGTRESHDARRGAGSYDKVLAAMQLLKAHRLPFGISCCYTSQNVGILGSEAFYDQMIELGASFAWFFHYMPVGNDAVPQLMPSTQQREWMYHQVRKFRQTKPLFTMDFQNDGEYVGGCIAGGRRYLHINANGDARPVRICALFQCQHSHPTACWTVCVHRCLWLIITGSPLTKITCGPAQCWKIRKNCELW